MQNLFIVGAQKAGTTALHSYLNRHHQISMSTPKELHFFDNETIDWSDPPYARLEARLGGAVARVRGEATPIYMYWPRSLERLRAYDRNAKIVVLLRHPVFRAHSHWRMETRRGAETLSFSDAIREGRTRVARAPQGAHRVFSYVERGFYAEQIERLAALFPPSQIYFETTDRLWLEPKSALSALERFLGVDEALDPPREYIVAADTRVDHVMDPRDEDLLLGMYAPDVVRTESLTGLALRHWLSADYREAEKVRA